MKLCFHYQLTKKIKNQAIEVINGSKKWGSRVSKSSKYHKLSEMLSQFSFRLFMVIPTAFLCQRTLTF